MRQTIALIGLGLLGSALAENLVQAAFAVRGFDTARVALRGLRALTTHCDLRAMADSASASS